MIDLETPKDIDLIKDRLTNIIGFTGLLLGLLVNAIVTVKFNEYESQVLLKLMFLVATFGLTMCAVSGMSTYIAITRNNINDPSKSLMSSFKWLIIGFYSIIIAIPVILFPSNPPYILILFLVILTIAMLYEAKKIRKR